MQAIRSKRGNLWRYNYAVLMGGGYWVLVLPLAASQMVTLWMMALASEFSQAVATNIAELMMPILGAFLVAHSMAPEYRSGIGAVLACKPVSLHRVVTMRVLLAMVLPILLTTVTLGVCSVGLKPVDLGPPLLAALPSLWFLSMLALTCATLFRSAPGGFAMAAVLWGLDLALGYSLNPFLSSRGLTAFYEADPLRSLWLYGKGTLLLGGCVLLGIHARLLPRVCRPAERRDIRKLVGTAAGLVLLYAVTGAAASVWYGYTHRSSLAAGDVSWFRRQLSLYGPIPVSRLFGPAFAEYVTLPPVTASNGTDGGATPGGGGARETREEQRGGGPAASRVALQAQPRITQLERALERWPRSIWADSLSFALAAERETYDPSAAIQDYRRIPDRYPASPFAPKALARIVRSDSPQVTAEQRLAASRELLAQFAATPEAEAGADFLLTAPGTSLEEQARAAETASRVAAAFRQPGWCVTLAQLLRREGKRTEALRAARDGRERALALRHRMETDNTAAIELRPHRADIDRALVSAEKLAHELEQAPG